MLEWTGEKCEKGVMNLPFTFNNPRHAAAGQTVKKARPPSFRRAKEF